MLYDDKLKEAMLDILENRMSGIADCIQVLFEEGYVPNKNKTTILNWSNILINAYESIDILTKEQQNKIDVIYNKVMNL